ncbi:hypothetical protein [Streptomyces sp. LMG1-1-1.1]|uniref:hypothetical protein n=1 Tax=Streptomyces sp. LMG1-1-1.1 TaxID=3135245 RepID=UPI003467CB09
MLGIPVDGISEGRSRDARTVTEFDGSAEEAEAALLQAAETFGYDLWKVRRREIFRTSSRSYFIRIEGRWNSYGFLLQLAERVMDSDVQAEDALSDSGPRDPNGPG